MFAVRWAPADLLVLAGINLSISPSGNFRCAPRHVGYSSCLQRVPLPLIKFVTHGSLIYNFAAPALYFSFTKLHRRSLSKDKTRLPEKSSSCREYCFRQILARAFTLHAVVFVRKN